MKRRNTDFFIGYARRVPEALRVFLPVVAGLLVAVFAAVGLLVGIGQANPGEGRFRWDLGQQTVFGVLEAVPWPLVHVEAGALYPNGRTLMLTGQGKRGVRDDAVGLSGQRVEVTGFITRRGDLDMLVVDRMTAAPAAIASDPPKVTQLGRWKLTGEICDGKCVSGAMRPGRGISHKACANLCLIGDVPAVFVAHGAIEGHGFFLIAMDAAAAARAAVLDHVAVPVQVEGLIERRGDLAILHIDARSLKAL